jgi:hypothetical protein
MNAIDAGVVLRHKSVVLDGQNCLWSHSVIGMPSVVPIGGRLALYFGGVEEEGIPHVGRDIGMTPSAIRTSVARFAEQSLSAPC